MSIDTSMPQSQSLYSGNERNANIRSSHAKQRQVFSV